jgi:hypothetical protein
MAEPRRALRQTGVPAYEFPLGDAIARLFGGAAAPAIAQPVNPVEELRTRQRAPVVVPAVDTDAVARVTRQAFPTIAAVRDDSTMQDEFARGNVGRGIGAGIRKAGGYTVAGAVDLVGAPVAAASRGLGNVAAGIVGGVFNTDGKPSSEAVVKAAGGTVAQPVRDIDAINAALAQGRGATDVPTALTPQDALGKYITAMFAKGATPYEAREMGALVPALAKGPGLKPKDIVLGQAAELSKQTYTDQLAAVEASVKKGETTAEQAAVDRAKLMQIHFQNLGGLVGFNPLQQAQAQMMEEQD